MTRRLRPISAATLCLLVGALAACRPTDAPPAPGTGSEQGSTGAPGQPSISDSLGGASLTPTRPSTAQAGATPIGGSVVAPDASDSARQAPLADRTLEGSPSTAGTAGRAATPEPPILSTPLPTLEAMPRAVIEARDSEPSPDQRWIVRHLVHDESRTVLSGSGSESFELPFRYHTQHLVSVDGTITHTIHAEWIADALGVSLPLFVGWDPASRAAYVTTAGAGDGCAVNGWSESLLRVDVTDGAVRELGTVGGTPRLSPDGRRIGAVRGVEGGQVELRWIETGDGEALERPSGEYASETGYSSIAWLETAEGEAQGLRFGFPLDDDPTANGQEGPPTWSPDGTAVIVPFHYGACSETWRNRLVLVDLRAGESQVIWEPDERHGRIEVEEWTADGLVRMSAHGYGGTGAPGTGTPLLFDAIVRAYRPR